MPSFFHLHSRYARLGVTAIDEVIRHVRDADEVLFGCDALDARDMIRAARTVFETECLFAQQPEQFAELDGEARSDWTLACMAEGLAQASVRLRDRGSLTAAQRVLVDQRIILERIIESPLRSPLVGYDAVLSALMHELRPDTSAELIKLQRLALAEALISNSQTNVRSLLCDLADSHLKLGQVELALTMFLSLARFDPTDIWICSHLAISLSRRFPELAHAAATRALLLVPREDKHALRSQLRAIIEETSRSRQELPAGAARVLHRELQGQPGKRSRAALRSLCLEIAPEVEWLPAKETEPLPDSAALAQLRRDLQTLPHTIHPRASNTEPARTEMPHTMQPSTAAPTHGSRKVGRNDPCPCGSEKKWKRCCGAR